MKFICKQKQIVFIFIDAIGNKRKRQVVGGDARSHVNRYYQIHEKRNQQKQEPIPGPSSSAYLNIPTDQTIKTEPRDTSPTPYLYGGGSLLQIGNYRVPQGSPSPQSLSPATPTPGYFNQPSPTYNNMAMPQTILQNFGGNDITGGNTMNMSPILNPFQNNNYQNIGGGGNNNSLNPLLPSLDTLQNHWNLPTNNILNNINNNDYNNKQQQQQQQQQHHQQQQQQQQQNNLNLNPFHDNYNDPTINLNQNTIKDNNNININIGDTIITNSNIFLDLDSHQVNSSELANIYQQIPSLLDVKQEQSILMEQEEQNMTDSFNKLSTSTINGIAVLNTYKRKNDNL